MRLQTPATIKKLKVRFSANQNKCLIIDWTFFLLLSGIESSMIAFGDESNNLQIRGQLQNAQFKMFIHLNVFDWVNKEFASARGIKSSVCHVEDSMSFENASGKLNEKDTGGLESESEELEVEIKELKDKINMLEVEIKELKDELKEQKDKIKELETKGKDASSERSVLILYLTQINRLREEITELNKRLLGHESDLRERKKGMLCCYVRLEICNFISFVCIIQWLLTCLKYFQVRNCAVIH